MRSSVTVVVSSGAIPLLGRLCVVISKLFLSWSTPGVNLTDFRSLTGGGVRGRRAGSGEEGREGAGEEGREGAGESEGEWGKEKEDSAPSGESGKEEEDPVPSGAVLDWDAAGMNRVGGCVLAPDHWGCL